ncbi:MAG TPA: FAD-binding protein, partial [Thermaerobacter sp.]
MTPAGATDGVPERVAVVRPATLEELARLVREARRVLPRGGGTKVRSWGDAQAPDPGSGRGAEDPWGADGVLVLDTTGLAGVVEYDPAEFTVTVRAGTPVAALESLLAEHGQYLPFDPLLVDAGATVGGTVAMGVSGACRLRYGGVRDFVLGVTCVDGEGRVVRAGGRVVKNAAGYDLPKFLCGSMGRFAVLAELTLKVFPRPEDFLTVVLVCLDVAEAATALRALYRSPLEPHALEVAAPGVLDGLLPAGVGAASPTPPAGSAYVLLVRIGGPAAILRGWADRVIERVRDATGRRTAAEVLAGPGERRLWNALRELAWVGGRDGDGAGRGTLL